MTTRLDRLNFTAILCVVAISIACTGRITRSRPQELQRTSRPPDTAAVRRYSASLAALTFSQRAGSANDAMAHVRAAVTLLEQAVATDSQFPEALGALAESNLMLGIQNTENRQRSRRRADLALARDSGVARAYSALGWLLFFEEHKYDSARIAFERALTLDTTLVFARFGYGLLLASQGEFDRALTETERAERAGVVRPNWRFGSEAVLFFARRYREAADRAARPIRRGSPIDYFWLGNALIQLGRPDSALAALEARVQEASLPGSIASLAAAYAAAGRNEGARRLRAQLDSMWRAARDGDREPCSMLPCHQFAVAHLAAGDTDGAMRWLEKSLMFAGVVPWGHWVAVDPRLDPLRHASGFQRVLHRAGHTRRKSR